MKVTVCQLDPSAETLDAFLEGLAGHIADTGSDFLLLPEMGFAEWLAADPIPDTARWTAAVAAHDRHIANLGRLGARRSKATYPRYVPE